MWTALLAVSFRSRLRSRSGEKRTPQSVQGNGELGEATSLNQLWTSLNSIDYASLLNPHILLVVTIPLLFYLLFPLYWYVFCPWIWSINPEHAHPKTWLLLYWLIGSIVWLLVLAYVYHSQGGVHGSASAKAPLDQYPVCESPMEFWQEDHLSNESYQLYGSPSTSSRVTLEQIQPANSDNPFQYGSMSHGLNGPHRMAQDYWRLADTYRRYSDVFPLRHARYVYSTSTEGGPEVREQVELNLSYSDPALERPQSESCVTMESSMSFTTSTSSSTTPISPPEPSDSPNEPGWNGTHEQDPSSMYEDIPYCDTWEAFLDKYSLATEGIGLFTVAIIGILANALSIAILAQRTMKTQISALLITLAVFDMLFLFCTFPVFTVSSANKFVQYTNECIYPGGEPWSLLTPGMAYVYKVSLPFLYGFVHVSKVGSVFTTLAVSLERYFAVCKPLWIRIRRCHPATYIVIVTLFALGFNITKFLEFETRTVDGVTDIYPTNIRTNPHYIVYYNFWTKTLVSEFFPFVALLYLNVCIFRDIRRSVKIQKNLRCTQSQKEEIKSANVVVGVVALAIFCHSWKIPPDLYEAYIKLKGNQDSESQWTDETGHPISTNVVIEMFIDTSHFLVGLNSAANFFIYFILRKNFRAATKRFLTCQPAPPIGNHFRQPTVITRSTNISDNGIHHSPVTDDELCSEENGGHFEMTPMRRTNKRQRGPMYSNLNTHYNSSLGKPTSYNSNRLHTPQGHTQFNKPAAKSSTKRMINCAKPSNAAESAVLLNHQGGSVTTSSNGKSPKYGDAVSDDWMFLNLKRIFLPFQFEFNFNGSTNEKRAFNIQSNALMGTL
eukprot:snap_masked-scaffold80_size398941-processed-gene-0.0 protein:Tk02816 transcript:snap_masked-scaffold80_size398941-processed-gene-0.0-mRNA-1 annotation:"fmrfamide receptor"